MDQITNVMKVVNEHSLITLKTKGRIQENLSTIKKLKGETRKNSTKTFRQKSLPTWRSKIHRKKENEKEEAFKTT